MVLLAHELVVSPQQPMPRRWALVLHGILGSRRNWKTFVKRLSEAHPEWGFIIADLRNHGDSHGHSGPDTLASCARDLRELCGALGVWPERVIGHSFGGKVALTFARDALVAPTQTWVLDATPSPMSAQEMQGASTVVRVLEALRGIPVPIPSRAALVDTLLAQGFSQMLASWMTTNLTRKADGFHWRFHLDGIEAMLADYAAADLWGVALDPAPGTDVFVVRAARSDRWTTDIVSRLHGPRTHLMVLEDAGHWVHVDNPSGLAEMLSRAFVEGA